MPEIVFPKDNENEFIKLAEKLDIKELFFIYQFQKDIRSLNSKVKDLQKSTKIKLRLGIFASSKDIFKARQSANFVITDSNDQSIFEKARPNIVFNLEQQEKKDHTHFRSSGFNQVLAKAAHKNKITIGFSLSSLNTNKRTLILGRMLQNLRFCKKYKVNTVFACFSSDPWDLRSEKDRISLLNLLNQ